MALELIAAIVAAFGVGGLAYLLVRLSRGRLPRWIVPASAGAALIAFTVWSEYDWFDRVSARLPEGLEVVAVSDEPMPLRPWTYLAPIRMRFVALDHRKTAAHPSVAGLRLVTLYSFARWQNPREALWVVDCPGARRAMLTAGAQVADDGTLTGAEWQPVADGDATQAAACREV